MSSGYVAVETRRGERLYVIDDSNHVAGYWITNFLIVISNYSAALNEDDANIERYKWLIPLDQYFQNDLAGITKSIRQSYYSGHWDLRENEYEVFKSRLIVPVPISEDEYRKTVQAINKMWADIGIIITTVEKILDGLRTVKIENVAGLFDSVETLKEFESLLETLRILDRRGASSVRLNVL